MKIARSGSESGSIIQRHGSEDPDPDLGPHQNVMDPQHWLKEIIIFKETLLESSAAICWGDGSFSFLKKDDKSLLIALLQSLRFRILFNNSFKFIP